MAAATDFSFEVITKALVRVGWVGDPTVLTFTPRHMQQPSGALTLPTVHQYGADLNTEGERYRCYYRDEYLSSGRVAMHNKTGMGGKAFFTWQLEDDWRLLMRVVGLPVPGSAITAQSGAEWDVRTGPAETVAKGYLTANLARISAALGQPVTIAADQGRGATVEAKIRMQPLGDVLIPLCDQAGIGITVRHIGDELVVDCYEPTVWPIVLSEDAGTLLESEWSRTPPTVTRVYMALDGDGTARNFRGPFINTAAEALYGDVIESVVDARDIAIADAGSTATILARANEALAAGAAVSGLSVKLAETDNSTYGGANGLHVGDTVTVELAPGIPVTDVLRSTTLTVAKGGKQVTPTVGDRTDDPVTGLMRTIQRLERNQRRTAGA